MPVQRVFIGSCTNSRIEDLRAAAAIAKGRKVADGVNALVVPGSGHVKHQAEEEGLDRIFLEAGFEWRDAGCSMCMSMNDDKAMNGERVATTSNRNFEGRQGKNAKIPSDGPGHGRRRRHHRPPHRRAPVGLASASRSSCPGLTRRSDPGSAGKRVTRREARWTNSPP